jgi:hypothetical protein
LTESERQEWDAFVAKLGPDDEGPLEFRFSYEPEPTTREGMPPEHVSSHADWPLGLLRQAVQAATQPASQPAE